MYYTNLALTTTEEVLMYDLNQTVATVGGLLGLSLRYSCNGVAAAAMTAAIIRWPARK